MPEINVTMDDGGVAVDVRTGIGATDEQIADSVDGSTLESLHLGELLLNQYASAADAPAGSGVGIIGVTDDGHILVEDGQ